MLKRTKIITTIGPSCDDDATLKEIILAGTDLIRINMSHSSNKEHINWIKNVSKISKELNKQVGIIVDLQGPKLRISKFAQHTIDLKAGNKFTIDTELDPNAGDKTIVGTEYKDLPKDVKQGDILLFDDGNIVMEVISVSSSKVHCTVKSGGKLSNSKGYNKKGGGLTAAAFTEKDKKDLLIAIEHNVDYVALSFPKTANDIIQIKELLKKSHCNAGIIAKIERVEALEQLDEIIRVSDAIMVARGDLGIEVGFAELPIIQKDIIKQAKALDCAVITATQMMESMINNAVPTRAEVSDVANAILDGTDAVMLSGETAIGKYPVQVVTSVAQICHSIEKQKITTTSHHRLQNYFKRIDEAIAMSTMYAANHLSVKAIIAFTESGFTPLLMSRIKTGIPIYGVSRNKHAIGKMTLYKGVYPIDFNFNNYKTDEAIEKILTLLQEKCIIKTGEKIIITMGDVLGIVGTTNSMKIITVGETYSK